MIEKIPSTIAIPFSAASFLFLIEHVRPLRKSRASLIRRLMANGFLAILGYSMTGFVVQPVAANILNWNHQAEWGLLGFFKLPAGVELLLGLLLLDLTFYYWHRLNHKNTFLWRFHKVHHCDEDLDISTGLRFHFGEVAMSVLFRVAQILATGISIQTFSIYVIVFHVSTFFQHSNSRLPWKFEKFLQSSLVTPRMHEFHHSIILKETHSNFSVVFSWWDRFHKTETKIYEHQQTTIGLDGREIQSSKDNPTNILDMILLPFRRQRKLDTINQFGSNG